MMTFNFAFILSGCGVHGGTENNELTMALLAVHQLGGTFEIFAPDAECDLVDPFTGEDLSQKGNILYESAKISSGLVRDLRELNVENFDGLVLPGGYGVTKSLSNINDFLTEGEHPEHIIINDLVRQTIVGFHGAKKAIIAICMAPILVASIIEGCKMTLGEIENEPKNYPIQLNYLSCGSHTFVLDYDHKVYSTPAFMASRDLGVVYDGIKGACGAAKNRLDL